MEYIFIALLLYESLISSIFSFSYIDEIIAVILVFLALVKIIKEKKIVLTKNEINISIFIILIYIIGAISASIFKIQNNLIISLISGCLSLKALISYVAFRIVFANSNFKYNKDMLKFTEIGLYGMATLGLIDRFIPIYPRLKPRFGIYPTALCFKIPTMLAAYAIISLLICYFLINNGSYKNKKNKLLIDIISASFLIIISGRTKAIGFLILFLLIIIKEKIFETDKKVKIISFIIPIIVVVCFAYGYIKDYFFNSTQSRAIMLRTSIEVAKDCFPVGSGFGTFGTDMSRQYYSKLYKVYGISKEYGLSEDFSAFVTDSMFPAIIGETGFIGIILYVLVFYNIFDNFLKNVKKRKNQIFLYLIVFYILIECVAESILMTSRGVLLFCFIAFVMNYFLQREDYNERDEDDMQDNELEKILEQDKKNYYSTDKYKMIYDCIVKNKNVELYKTIKYARKYRYYLENRNGLWNKIKFCIYARLNNIVGSKNNVELYGEFGENLKIYHGNIMVNKEAKIGNNVKMHGFNCIGNNGKDKKAPKIGNNVDIGVGAIIIGDIELADNIIVGANAVVNKSFLEEGITIAGVPARKISN